EAEQEANKLSLLQTLSTINEEERNHIRRMGVKNLSLPSSIQDEAVDFGRENKVTDIQIRAKLDGLFKQTTLTAPSEDAIFVIYLPPGVRSTLGQMHGGKHYLAYHSYYYTEGGRVNYVVLPFDSDAHRRQETIQRAVIEAILNPVGNGWY